MRRLLDEAKATLVDVRAGFAPYVDAFERLEPTDDEASLVRKLIEKAIDNS